MRRLGNPFYGVLICVAAVFAITACAYGLLIVTESTPSGDPFSGPAARSSLMVWMERHGARALVIELAVLGATTLAAMLTDDLWQRSARRPPARHGRESDDSSVPPR